MTKYVKKSIIIGTKLFEKVNKEDSKMRNREFAIIGLVAGVFLIVYVLSKLLNLDNVLIDDVLCQPVGILAVVVMVVGLALLSALWEKTIGKAIIIGVIAIGIIAIFAIA